MTGQAGTVRGRCRACGWTTRPHRSRIASNWALIHIARSHPDLWSQSSNEPPDAAADRLEAENAGLLAEHRDAEARR